MDNLAIMPRHWTIFTDNECKIYKNLPVFYW